MADTPGAGQQNPWNAVGDFNPHAFAIAQALAQVDTIKIVKVMAVDIDAHTVDVQIATNLLDGNGNATAHGTINNVPYAWAMGGKNAFQIDPAVGDLGAMVVCDRDISAVKAAKAIANPGSLRTFCVSDGIYLFSIPGLNGTTPEQWIKWTDDGISIQTKHGNTLTSDATGWKFIGQVTMQNNVIMQSNLQLAGSVQSDTGSTYAGNIQTTGDVIAGSISLKGHHHTAQGATAPTTVAQP